MFVALGADHAGFELKEALKRALDARGVAWHDVGTASTASVDYPDYAVQVADALDEAQARIFAAEQGYDLVDDQGMLTDWWGYCWMILAEKRGLLTAENRAAARAAIEEKYLSAPNVIGVIVGR